MAEIANRDFNVIRERYIACRNLKDEPIVPKKCDCCGLTVNQKEIDEQNNKMPKYDCSREVYNSTKDHLTYKETHQILRSCGYGPLFIQLLMSD